MTADERGATSAGSIGFTVILWLLALVVVFGALSFSYPAKVAPLLLGGTAAALLTWLVTRDAVRFVRHRRGGGPAGDGRSRLDADATEPAVAPGGRHLEVMAIAWTLGSIALLVLLGFVVGMTIAMLGLLRVYAREGWVATIVTTAAVMLSLYVAFGVVLNVGLFPGVLGLWR